MLEVPLIMQENGWNCGPASVQMLLAFHGKKVTQKRIARLARTTKNGTHHKQLVKAIKHFNITARAEKTTFRKLKSELNHGKPAILNYSLPKDNDGHFAVAVSNGKKFLTLNDPLLGKKRYSIKRFGKLWFDSEDNCRNLAIFTG